MVQLGTERTVLFLYGLLVVLPAVVFGGLLWHLLTTDHDRRLAEVPTDASDAAARILDAIERRLDDLLQNEHARPFYHFQQDMYEGDATTGVIPFKASPIYSGEMRPDGVVVWFSYDELDGEYADIETFYGANDVTLESEELKERHLDLIRDHVGAIFRIRPRAAVIADMTLKEATDDVVTRTLPLDEVAVNLHFGRDQECIASDLGHLAEIQDESVPVLVSTFDIRVVRDVDSRPFIVVSRKVLIRPLETEIVLPACLKGLGRMTYKTQGFVIDPDWLFVDLPQQIENEALGASQQLLVKNFPAESIGEDYAIAEVQIFDRFDNIMFDELVDRELGIMRVAVNEGRIASTFRKQRFWFGCVATVMIVSLCIGLRLLLGSIRASQEQARRTENFVASVTHELRTPVATVKLYGEMLKDGWVADEDKRQEYLTRIVREANRLDTLVDRVLEKRRLGEGARPPRAGDLNHEVCKQEAELTLSRGTEREDLVFDLAPNLPPVMLTTEGVHAILVNLVENARKYAPVDMDGPGAEPIRVVTHKDRKGRVVLEVLDRGPGIPDGERTKVFGAFYRMGDEATRTTVGTGLGLHLVSLTARSLDARVQALPRPEGGTAVQVTFKTLKPGTLS